MAMRKRIGVMVPSTNTTCEADFQAVAPTGVTIHGQRLWLTNDASGESETLTGLPGVPDSSQGGDVLSHAGTGV